MGLATIDSHSLKELTEIHNIPIVGVKIYKEMYGNQDAASECHTFLCKF